MNLGSHIAIAERLSPQNERLWLGSALPDLAAIGRFRLLGSTADSNIRDGVALHHRTDDVFHRHPWFTERQKRLRTELTEAGVGRGATRAIAHAGQELLLDGAMLQQTNLREQTERALAEIVEAKTDLGTLVLDRVDEWPLHLDKILAWGTPHDYHEPKAVAARLHRILARRPRLSFDETLIPVIADVLEREVASIFESAEPFVREIADQVADLS